MESHEPLLTVEDLATYLDVPVATIYAWRYRHTGPPGFRVGRHVRFRWSDVELWIGQQLEVAIVPGREAVTGPSARGARG